jgi:hypothetical protein
MQNKSIRVHETRVTSASPRKPGRFMPGVRPRQRPSCTADCCRSVRSRRSVSRLPARTAQASHDIATPPRRWCARWPVPTVSTDGLMARPTRWTPKPRHDWSSLRGRMAAERRARSCVRCRGYGGEMRVVVDGEFGALIPRERPFQRLGQVVEGRGKAVGELFCARSGAHRHQNRESAGAMMLVAAAPAGRHLVRP